MKEGDVAGTDRRREIARDTNLGIGVAVHVYTKIIDVVNRFLDMDEPDK